MENWSKSLLKILLAPLLGALLVLAFAPYQIFPLSILAPAGLLWLWLESTPKKAFILGWLFGLGLFGFGVYWVYISIHQFGGVPIPLAIGITGALMVILALFPAVVGYVLTRYFDMKQTSTILLAFPACWVMSEWIRSWIFTGFPWLFLGYSQTNSPLKGYAALFGVYGVSLFVLLSSALLVTAYLKFQSKQFLKVYYCLFGLIAIWGAGALLCLIPWTQAIGQAIPISLVQGNIPQSLKWDPAQTKLSEDQYLKLTENLWSKSKIIIWPEAAIPKPLLESADLIQTLDDRAVANGNHLILGIPINASQNKSYYNGLVTLGPEKKVYLKRHLVPFGEYTPRTNLINWIMGFMDIPMSDLIPGKINQGPLVLGSIKILPSICYEIAFPDLIWVADPTISFLLTVTNDAWFGKSSAQAQHLQMAAMRAIEFNRPVLMVSNDGITASIAPDGTIQEAAPTHEAYVLNTTVQPRYGMTPWMRNGSDPILFILVLFLSYTKRETIFNRLGRFKNKLSDIILVIKK